VVTEVIMPSAGQISDALRIIRWHKKVGEKVKKGEVLFEIETDKATMEIESYRDGVLLAILHRENEQVQVGKVVAYIGEQGEQPSQGAEQGRTPERSNIPGPSVPQEKRSSPGKPLASPRAKRLAREHHLDLEEIARVLPKGVIKERDILSFLGRTTETDEWYYLPLSSGRKAIAQRVIKSVTSIPQYSMSIDVDMSECIHLRNHLKERLAVKTSYNDFIMKCAAKAIEKYPLVNAILEKEQIKVHKDVNFGLVVRVDEGLLIPVVRGVNRKSLLEVAWENQENIRKARNKELEPETMSSGTITLSNLGMYGIDRFTALINPPETCILAVGKISERPACREGRVLAIPSVTITASFDHRLIDGAYGAQFLMECKGLLENPWFLLP